MPGLAVLKNFQLRLSDGHTPVIDEEGHKIVLFISSSAETPIGPYSNEYVFQFKTSEDGTQIEEIVEFVDTAPTFGFTDKLKAHMASLLGGTLTQ